VAAAATLSTVYTPIYETMAAVAAIFSTSRMCLPTALGLATYGGAWTVMGPWNLGRLVPPAGRGQRDRMPRLIAIGMHPPNEKSLWIVGGVLLLLAVVWFAGVKDRFAGPPEALVRATSSRA
jgi:hypothetical protein